MSTEEAIANQIIDNIMQQIEEEIETESPGCSDLQQVDNIQQLPEDFLTQETLNELNAQWTNKID